MISDVISSKPIKYIIYVQFILVFTLSLNFIVLLKYDISFNDNIISFERYSKFYTFWFFSIAGYFVVALHSFRLYNDPDRFDLKKLYEDTFKVYNTAIMLNILCLTIIVSLKLFKPIYIISAFHFMINISVSFSIITFISTVLKSTKYE